MKADEATVREIPLGFSCGKDRLYGIFHRPAQPALQGILIVTGRPALRAGRHRLYVTLARMWAQQGIPVMRFDFRGTGDCEGEMGTLDETSEDIASAVEAFFANAPGLQRVILWGLCGGATDSILYAPRDARIAGIAMVNPWYYDARVRQLAKINRSVADSYERLRDWIGGADTKSEHKSGLKAASEAADGEETNGLTSSPAYETAAVQRAYSSYRDPDLSNRLAENLERFKGSVLLILSGDDTGSKAFKHATAISLRWHRILSSPRVRLHELPGANHSLRRSEWREQAAAWTLEWVRGLDTGRV